MALALPSRIALVLSVRRVMATNIPLGRPVRSMTKEATRPTSQPTRDRTRAMAPLQGEDQAAHERIIAAQVKTKVWLELDGGVVIGDGGVRLLLGIVRHDSLAEAVRELLGLLVPSRLGLSEAGRGPVGRRTDSDPRGRKASLEAWR